MICWLFAGICSTGGVASSSRVSSSCSTPSFCDQRTTRICTTTGLSSAFMIVKASVRWAVLSCARMGEILNVLALAGTAMTAKNSSATSDRILVSDGDGDRVGIASRNGGLIGRAIRQLAEYRHGVGGRHAGAGARNRLAGA